MTLCLNDVFIASRRLWSGSADARGCWMLHRKSITLLLHGSSIHGPPIGFHENFDRASGISTPSSLIWRCLFTIHTPSGCLPAHDIPVFNLWGSLNGKSFSRWWWSAANSLSESEHINPSVPKVDWISFNNVCHKSRDSIVKKHS